MAVHSFTELQCWKAARELAKRIFWLTKVKDFHADRRLVEQINDSTDSVMANIAEGFGRGTQAEFKQFLGYSIGSLDETRSHLCVAFDRSYVSREVYADLWNDSVSVRRMTVGFNNSMVRPGGGVKFATRRENWQNKSWEKFERLTGQKRPAVFEALRPEEQDRPEKDDQPPT